MREGLGGDGLPKRFWWALASRRGEREREGKQRREGGIPMGRPRWWRAGNLASLVIRGATGRRREREPAGIPKGGRRREREAAGREATETEASGMPKGGRGGGDAGSREAREKPRRNF